MGRRPSHHVWLGDRESEQWQLLAEDLTRVDAARYAARRQRALEEADAEVVVVVASDGQDPQWPNGH